jgi:hypothetical protein
MSSEESNKMSKKTPSQDSNSEEEYVPGGITDNIFSKKAKEEQMEWDLEEMKKALLDNADDYDKLIGG